MQSSLQRLLHQLGRTPQTRFTLDEVGDLLGMSRLEVLNQVKRGRIPAMKVSARKWGYVLSCDLEAYVAGFNGGTK